MPDFQAALGSVCGLSAMDMVHRNAWSFHPDIRNKASCTCQVASQGIHSRFTTETSTPHGGKEFRCLSNRGKVGINCSSCPSTPSRGGFQTRPTTTMQQRWVWNPPLRIVGQGGFSKSIICCADCGRSWGFTAMAESIVSSMKREYLLRKDFTAGVSGSFPTRDLAIGGGLQSRHIRMVAPTA